LAEIRILPHKAALQIHLEAALHRVENILKPPARHQISDKNASFSKLRSLRAGPRNDGVAAQLEKTGVVAMASNRNFALRMTPRFCGFGLVRAASTG